MTYPITILKAGKYNEGVCQIIGPFSVEPLGHSEYHLIDDAGEWAASCEHPKPLATHAFSNGAVTVKHVYDLLLVAGFSLTVDS